jgi:hypothetical protein
MIEFKESRLPDKRLTTLTAYISETELHIHGKNFAITVIHELIKKLIFEHIDDLEKMVVELTVSPEMRKFIEDEIKIAAKKAIQNQINEMFP